MPIDYSRLRSIITREIISALIRDGFYLRGQKGSHQRYYHPDGRRVTVSFVEVLKTHGESIQREELLETA